MPFNYRMVNRPKTNYSRYYTHFNFIFLSLGRDICLKKELYFAWNSQSEPHPKTFISLR